MSPCVDAFGNAVACPQHPLLDERLVHAEVHPGARVMLIGEAPGEKEVEEGRPFVGPAGEFLDETLDDNGFRLDHLYITNVVKHRPLKISQSGTMKDRRPCAVEIRAYRPWLASEIARIEPKLIIALGNVAMQWFCGSKYRITRVRGKSLTWKGTSVLPTFHPSYVRRHALASQTRKDWERDLRVAFRSISQR